MKTNKIFNHNISYKLLAAIIVMYQIYCDLLRYLFSE